MIAVRFYPQTQRMRMILTSVWALLLIGMLPVGASIHTGRKLSMLVWIVLPLLQLMTLWTSYWEIATDRLVQHGLFSQRSYAFENLRYAGPVRSTKLQRWLRSSIELQTTDFGSVRYAAVSDRSTFLRLLGASTRSADIVPF